MNSLGVHTSNLYLVKISKQACFMTVKRALDVFPYHWHFLYAKYFAETISTTVWPPYLHKKYA